MINLHVFEDFDSMCDAHPAAPDVSEKMQCESNNAMLSAATNAYCSSSDCLQKPRSIHSKIDAKSMKNRAQGAQNSSKFDLAAPNRCQIFRQIDTKMKLPESIFR